MTHTVYTPGVDVHWVGLHEYVPVSGYWDQGLLVELLNRFRLPSQNGPPPQLFIIPGASHSRDTDAINELLSRHGACVVIVTSDEERLFPVEQLEHANMRLWVQYANGTEPPGTRILPVGYPPQCRVYRPWEPNSGVIDWAFAGQITHDSRKRMMRSLANTPNGEATYTDRFSAGLEHEAYYQLLWRARTVPCPAGPIHPDSFRVWEALEMGALPIIEAHPYWDHLFGRRHPLPVSNDWEKLPVLIPHLARQYPRRNAIAQAWWLQYKRRLAYRLMDDIRELSV